MRALVIGSASCVWEDLRAFDRTGLEVDQIICVNDAIWAYPYDIDHAATLHPEHFKEWSFRRGKPKDYLLWSNKDHHDVDRHIKNWGAGSSGMLGVVVGLELCDEVVIAGIPLSNESHFFDERKWSACFNHRKSWVTHKAKMLGRVTSMSGWTMELLGHPVREAA